MGKMLAAAQCHTAVAQVVAGVFSACRECRAWASNASQIKLSVELVTAPDQEVERGFFFCRQCW
eukprot:4124160-Pyramimonas_sp.AAC.1